MNTVAIKLPKSKRSQPKPHERKFELISRSKSGWVKKGTENSANPMRLNSAASYPLPMRSRRYLGEGNGYAQTQYVPGADTIYLDDWANSEGEVRSGLRNQKYDLEKEYARAAALGVAFKFGILDLNKYGEDPLLLDFILNHEDNVDTEVHTDKGGRDVRKSQRFNFKLLRQEEKAKRQLASLEEDVEAMIMVGKLRYKKDDKFVYNQELINALSVIFEIPGSFGAEDPNQKMTALVALAKRNGAGFLEAIKEVVDEHRMGIADAIKYGVLTISTKEAKIMIGAEQNAIKKMNGSTEDGRIEELTYFFIGDVKGRQNYSQIVGETEIKKAQSVKQA